MKLLLLAVPLALTCSAAPVPLLHMDATAQSALRRQQSLPPLGAGQAADIVLASRGVSELSTLNSELAAHRPVFTTDGTHAFLRFDGENDYLALSGPRQLAPAVTVFILAAPRGNAGQFSGFFACAEAGKNDYTSGLNLDLGPDPGKELSVLNVESAGTQGWRDLLIPGQNLAADLPFGGFHVFTVRSQIKPGGDELWLDGIKLGARDRLESMIGLDRIILGARYYSNDSAQQPFVASHLHGDIAEFLVFDSALPDSEAREIEQRLMEKAPALTALAAGRNGHALQVLQDAPPVQMLVPGFTVSELPVKLTNRNNLRYRHDGKLVALGYDGTIHILTDSDGDGMEDTAAVFWEKPTLRGPLGIALTKKDDPRGDGVFVASKGKVSLILDRDRDGRADEEIIVASGWQEIPQNVDAVGMAVDPQDGSLYFGLGCANYANGYLIDPATGKAAYDLKSERGTIQKVSADFKTRTTVCTGVRFTCALEFNREGDLFATEQEGATWLPNGNPLDELLHIQPGKHYGFPPRHPRHLPDVLDWPAVMEYGPQHQSAVGMIFNDSVNGGPTFGPDFWAGDALVCGEARGKLYRTKLVKTPHGYIAQNNLIACLGLLTVDACVSPRGDLLIACHTGPPDWGTGPKGDGRIYRVRYTGKDVPQPVWAWAAAPDEFRVAFDKDLSPEDWKGLIASTGGPSVRKDRQIMDAAEEIVRKNGQNFRKGGENFQNVGETFRTGGQIFQKGSQIFRTDSEIFQKGDQTFRTVGQNFHNAGPSVRTISTSADVAESPNSLIFRKIRIEAGRHVSAGDRFEVIRPGYQVVRDQMAAPRRDVEVLGLSLSGDRRTIIIRIPRQTEPVGYAVTLPLPESWRQKSAIEQKPEMDVLVTLEGRPQAFEDAHLLPNDEAFRVTATDPFIPAVQPGATIDWKPEPSPVSADPAARTLVVHGHTLPLTAGMTRVPWAGELSGEAGQPAARDIPGNWLAGRRVFFGNEAACFTCHQIRGEGIAVGADLTNLTSRDSESVLRDILQPSAAINPDHPASMVKLKGGASLTGIVRTVTEQEVKVMLQFGMTQTLRRADVASVELLKASFMPEGYADRLTKEQQTDLLKFLLVNPLEPAALERTDPAPPPPRKLAEVQAILKKDPSDQTDQTDPPLRILLSAGPKDHGPGEHDYPLWQKRWTTLLGLAPGVTVDTAWEFPTAAQLAAADVTVFFSKNPGFNPRTALLLDEYQQRGGGLVYLHWAVNGDEHAQILAERIGLAGGRTGVKYRHGEFDLVFPQPEHPVTKGFPTLHFTDETYWAMQGDPARLTVLGTGVEDGAPQPQLWSLERHQGRVIGCVPGHYTWTFDDPLYRLLVFRAICWTAKQKNPDRLAELATVGARIAP